MPKFLTPIDMTKLEIQNARFQNLAAAPGTPAIGQYYYDTALNIPYIYSGSTLGWVAMTSGSSSSHNPVTLDTTADTILNLNIQQLSLDPQANNTVWAGSTSGSGGLTPTFRTLVAADLPSLDQITIAASSVNLNSNKIINLLNPTDAQDAATKVYVDNVASGIDAKASVYLASTVDIPSLSGSMLIDGIATASGSRVLVKAQNTPTQNGVYIVNSGSWTRSTDLSTWDQFVSAFVFVESGSTLADTGWVCTVDAGGAIGVDPITWVQFTSAGNYTAGSGLQMWGQSIAMRVPGNITSTSTNVADGTGHTHAVDSTIAKSSITITAGSGLTGGGDLTANRVIDVGAGDGISVAVDSVSANIDTAAGLKFDSSSPKKIQVGLLSTGGLQFTTGSLGAKLDGSTITTGSNGLKVTDNTYQPLDATLTALAGITSAASQIILGTGVDSFVSGALTDLYVATANKDGLAGTYSMRTLGSGSQQASSGSHVHAGMATKYTTAIGNTTLTDLPVTHNLNSRNIIVQVARTLTPFDVVYPDIEMTSASICVIRFAVAPATNEYTVTVIG